MAIDSNKVTESAIALRDVANPGSDSYPIAAGPGEGEITMEWNHGFCRGGPSKEKAMGMHMPCGRRALQS